MSVRLFQDMQPRAQIDPAQRGIAYGDGLFETLRVHGDEVPWWDRHWARLSAGAARLGIALPAQAFVREQVRALLTETDAEQSGNAVLKLIASRSAGGRGYRPDPQAGCDWQLSLHPLPPPARSGGLHLRWCELRLAMQPALAGIKHCNRLEQVLARAEWIDADIDEGLLLDATGSVVSATAANLFILRDGRWLTPPVDACGVAGVCRGWALDALEAAEQVLAPADVESAEAVFLCNAVRGILPIARLGTRRWVPHPATAAARARLAAAHPAFDPPEPS